MNITFETVGWWIKGMSENMPYTIERVTIAVVAGHKTDFHISIACDLCECEWCHCAPQVECSRERIPNFLLCKFRGKLLEMVCNVGVIPFITLSHKLVRAKWHIREATSRHVHMSNRGRVEYPCHRQAVKHLILS